MELLTERGRKGGNKEGKERGKGRGRGRRRENELSSSHWFTPQMAQELKPGVRNFIQVPHLEAGAQALGLFSAAFSGTLAWS